MTKDAIIVICTMMRMLLGVWLLTALIAALENAVTSVKANAIINEVDILEVTANAEQIPKTCKVIGLSLTSGVGQYLFSLIAQ